MMECEHVHKIINFEHTLTILHFTQESVQGKKKKLYRSTSALSTDTILSYRLHHWP